MDVRTAETLHQAMASTSASIAEPRSSMAHRRGVIAAFSALAAQIPFGLAADGKKGGKRKKRKKNKKGEQARADASCPGPRDLNFVINSGGRKAQTFTAATSGSLVRADLDISKNAGSDGDYLLVLSPVDDAGVPTEDVLAVTFAANAKVSAGETTVEFAFADPAEVKAGTQYALVLTRLDGANLTWLSRVGDVCAGRGFVSSAQPAPFEVLPNDDFIFTVFVRS